MADHQKTDFFLSNQSVMPIDCDDDQTRLNSELETNLKLIYNNHNKSTKSSDVPMRNQIIFRDWFFNKVEKILDISSSSSLAFNSNSNLQPTIKNVTVVFGQAGTGKTFLVQLLSETKRLKSRVLMSFYCNLSSFSSLSLNPSSTSTSITPNDFIENFDRQIQDLFNISTTKKFSSTPNFNVDFRENLLKSLNNLSKDSSIVNKHKLNAKRYLLLIDSIDLRPDICDLMASNLHAFPNWLHIIITARPKRYRGITKMFSGARKIVIDDIKKSNVYNDLWCYLSQNKHKIISLNQLRDESSSSNVTKQLFNKLIHKSNGSILYLKILLDCFELNIFDSHQQIDYIGATLNGLYLALLTTLFNNHLEIEQELKRILSSMNLSNSFKISLNALKQISNNDEESLSDETLQNILKILEHYQLILFTDNNTAIKLVHGSLFEWLSDIKHCTPRFHTRSNSQSSTANGSHQETSAARLETLIRNRNCINQKYLNDSLNNNDDSVNDISDDLLFEKDKSDSNLGLNFQSSSSNQLMAIDLNLGIYAEANQYHNRIYLDRTVDNDRIHKTSSLEPHASEKNYRFKSSAWKYDSVFNDSNFLNHNNNSNLFINNIESTTSNSLRNSKSKQLIGQIDDDCLVESDEGAVDQHLDENCDLSKTEISKEYLNKLYQKFENALHLCDLKTLRNILIRYSNVIINQNFINGKTPMYWAIKKSNMKLVQLFIEFHADINAVCDPQWGYSSLILALMQHSYDMCELLLENDADVELLDRYSMPPILHAILVNCSPEIIKLLLYWGSHTDFIDETGRSLLHFAANESKTWSQTINLLLTVGCDEMHKDNNGQTALHMAASNGSLETVEVLVEFGGEKLINTQDKAGKLALHEAVAKNNIEVCEPLITSKSINFAAHSGNTPLRIAILSYFLDLAQLLILKGADINYKDPDGRSIIYCVVAFTHSTLEQKSPPFFNVQGLYKSRPEEYLGTAVKTIEFLAKFGVDLEMKDLEGRTVLHVAAWQGTYAIVECLIKLGTNINAIDVEGRTPLHMCAWNGHIEIVRLLVESGANVDLVSSTQGASPLLVAAQQGHFETCAYLLKVGSNVTHRDFYGRNARDVAANCGHNEIVSLIDSIISLPNESVLSKNADSETLVNKDVKNSSINTATIEDEPIGSLKLSKYDSRFYNNSCGENVVGGVNSISNKLLSSKITSTNESTNTTNLHSVPNNKKGSHSKKSTKKTRSISKLTKILH
ncbi:post-GPI attachment to proteins factor [Sarcoptes scabiei]|nr:post-GPI attachment to proteins factor [Sarcoptes scabiei]